MGSLVLEIRYAFRERSVVFALFLSLIAASAAVVLGALQVAEQRSSIELLLQETDADQRYVLSQQSTPGDAAYYVFHLTYHPPAALAFAALGTREDLPWQHRLRMLALEGQIYEADTGNPELSQLGRLDFAFLVSVLLPLILILLLYDLDASERRAGRYELLNATSTSGAHTLLIKACARALLLFAAVMLPFVVVAAISNAPLAETLGVLVVISAHLLFWVVVCRSVTNICAEAPTAATVLLACWLLFTAAVPAAARIVVESAVPLPVGGEILLAQREAVNDAWDLPKDATMKPFVASHPELQPYAKIEQSFEWKWYYAFQQMGDETVQSDSEALRLGIARRDELMGLAAVFSPSLATERWLTHLAETDRAHHQDYMRCVRAFHGALRDFHYPMLFGSTEFSAQAMIDLPKYRYCDD